MKKILITGASQGIGFELAKSFSKTGDVALYLVARDKKKLQNLQLEIKKINPNIVSCIMNIDLTNSEAIKILMENIKNRFGYLDIIVHNAGTLVKNDFSKISKKQLEYTFNLNFFVPFLLTQKSIPLLSKNAHTIFISSIGGVNGTKKFPGLSAYSSSKGALITLTECLAEEFQINNIRFNCLALGAVQTEMLNKAFPGYKAPLSANEVSTFIVDFCINGGKYFNGKVIPLALTTP